MNEELNNLETRLRRQPPREIPPPWRREILSAAQVASHPAPSTSRLRQFLSTIKYQPSTGFRWGALAAIWVVIIALNHAASDPAPISIAKSTPPSPELRMALHEQRKLYLELTGATPVTLPVNRTQSPPPRPQSNRRSELQESSYYSEFRLA